MSTLEHHGSSPVVVVVATLLPTAGKESAPPGGPKCDMLPFFKLRILEELLMVQDLGDVSMV